jgi:hypothetical protein
MDHFFHDGQFQLRHIPLSHPLIFKSTCQVKKKPRLMRGFLFHSLLAPDIKSPRVSGSPSGFLTTMIDFPEALIYHKEFYYPESTIFFHG